jgi:hypothetical protein
MALTLPGKTSVRSKVRLTFLWSKISMTYVKHGILKCLILGWNDEGRGGGATQAKPQISLVESLCGSGREVA